MARLLPTKEGRGDQSLRAAIARPGADLVRRRFLRWHGASVQLGRREVDFDLRLSTATGRHIDRHVERSERVGAR
jgi:hypothetical protein